MVAAGLGAATRDSRLTSRQTQTGREVGHARWRRFDPAAAAAGAARPAGGAGAGRGGGGKSSTARWTAIRCVRPSSHRTLLGAVRRQAAVDGHAIDPWQLAAVLEGLRLRLDATLGFFDRAAILDAARVAFDRTSGWPPPTSTRRATSRPPLLSATTLARGRIIDQERRRRVGDFVEKGIAVEVSHRAARRLFGLAAAP